MDKKWVTVVNVAGRGGGFFTEIILQFIAVAYILAHVVQS